VPFCTSSYSSNGYLSCPGVTSAQLWNLYWAFYGMRVTAGVMCFAGIILAGVGMCVVAPPMHRAALALFAIELVMSIACWAIAAARGINVGGVIMIVVSFLAIFNVVLSLFAAKQADTDRAQAMQGNEYGGGPFQQMPAPGQVFYTPIPGQVYYPPQTFPPHSVQTVSMAQGQAVPRKAMPTAQMPQAVAHA
jgi:hypothetical protein